MVKKQVGIFGASFMKSGSLRGENADVEPKNFCWVHDDVGSPLFLAGSALHNVSRSSGIMCGILLEPPELRPENYDSAIKNQDKLDYIFTYDIKTLSKIKREKRRFFVLGGSSVAFDKWGMHEKTKDVCMFCSEKSQTSGHLKRQHIAKLLSERVDVFGANNPVETKYEVLKDYRYCIVVESCFSDYYFTEKLIDPISVGTIPVYLGCRGIGKWFNEFGITPLEWILEPGGFEYWLTEERYNNLHDVLKENLAKARNYAICEDWIYHTYPEVFNGTI